MENNKFDLKAVLAIGLGLFIWLGWQLYLNKKYPKANAAAVSTATPNTPDLAAKSTSEQNKGPNLVTSKETSKPINAPAKTFSISFSVGLLFNALVILSLARSFSTLPVSIQRN